MLYKYLLVKAFSLNEAVKAGLVDEELVDEEEIKAETPTRGERMKRPQLAEYSMVRYAVIYNSKSFIMMKCKKLLRINLRE